MEKKNTNKNSLNFPKVNELYGKKNEYEKKGQSYFKEQSLATN